MLDNGQQHLLSVFAYLAEDAVFHQEGLAADFLVAEHAVKVCAIGENVETLAHAVLGGYLVVYLHAVQHKVLPLVVVGQNLYARQPHAAEEAPVVGVAYLAGQFGNGVHLIGAIHAAGTDGKQYAFVNEQGFAQEHLQEKPMLGGNVAASKNDKVRFAHKTMRTCYVPSVQQGPTDNVDATVLKGREHSFGGAFASMKVIGR